MTKLYDTTAQNRGVLQAQLRKAGLALACIFVFAQIAIIGAPLGSPIQPLSSSISMPVSARLDESPGEAPLRAASFASRVRPNSGPSRDSVVLISRGFDSSLGNYPRLTLVRSPAAGVVHEKQARSYRAYPSQANVNALNEDYPNNTAITASDITSQLKNPNGSLAVVDLDPPTINSSSTILTNASEDLVFGFDAGSWSSFNRSIVAIVKNFDQTARNLPEPGNAAVRPNLDIELLRFNCKTDAPYEPCKFGPNDPNNRDPLASVRAIHPIDIDNNGKMDLLIAADSTRDANSENEGAFGARIFLCRNFGSRFGCKGINWRASEQVSPGIPPGVMCFANTSGGDTGCDGRPRIGNSMSAIASPGSNGEYSFITVASTQVSVTKTNLEGTTLALTQYEYDGYVSAAQFAQVNPHEDSLIDMLVHVRPVAAPENENSEDWLWRGPIPTTNINMIERIHVCRGVAGGTCVNQDPIPVSDGLVTATGGVGFRYGKSAPLIGVFDLAAPTGSTLDGKPEILIAATLAGDEASHIQDENNFREIRLLTIGGNQLPQGNFPSSSTLVTEGEPVVTTEDWGSWSTPGVNEVLSGMIGNFVNAHSSNLALRGFSPAPDIAIALKDSGDVFFINNRFSASAPPIAVRDSRLKLSVDMIATSGAALQ